MKEYLWIIFRWMLLIFVWCLCVFAIRSCYQCKQPSVAKSDTVYVERIVEVKDTAPGIKEEKVIGQVTFPVLSSSSNIGKNYVKETGKSLHDAANIEKNNENLNTTSEPIVQRDSVTFDIVQRKYTEDSTYTAYVSGLSYGVYPKLDSVIVRQKIVERTITNTIYREKKGLRVKFRPAVGGGYDPLNRGWGVYVGGALVLDW